MCTMHESTVFAARNVESLLPQSFLSAVEGHGDVISGYYAPVPHSPGDCPYSRDCRSGNSPTDRTDPIGG